jgi:hypothetical protein
MERRQSSRSVKITWTGGGRERSTSSSSTSRRDAAIGKKPDFYDLGYRPSNVDVHRCSSAGCTVCRGTVNFNHRLPRISSTDLIPQAYDDYDEHDDDNDNDDVRDDAHAQRGGGHGGAHSGRKEREGHRGQHRGNSSNNSKLGKYSSRLSTSIPPAAAILDVTPRDQPPKGGAASPQVKFVRVSDSRNMRDWHNYNNERLRRVLSKTAAAAAATGTTTASSTTVGSMTTTAAWPKYEEERNRRWVFL